jgi:hypothetical protein
MKWTPSNSDSAPPSNDASGTATQTNTNESIEQFIVSAVAEGFTELRKELAPTRRFINPVEADTFRVPATVKRYSSLKHFAGPHADERAYRFGMFCLGVYGKKQGIDFCLKQGIPLIGAGGDAISDMQTKFDFRTFTVSR